MYLRIGTSGGPLAYPDSQEDHSNQYGASATAPPSPAATHVETPLSQQAQAALPVVLRH